MELTLNNNFTWINLHENTNYLNQILSERAIAEVMNNFKWWKGRQKVFQ